MFEKQENGINFLKRNSLLSTTISLNYNRKSKHQTMLTITILTEDLCTFLKYCLRSWILNKVIL